MKKMLLFFLISLSTSLLADTCGYGEKFQEISCPAIDGKDATISSVNYLNGTYTCRYADSSNNKSIIVKKIKCVDQFLKLSDISKGKADDKDAKLNTYIHDFADKVLKKKGMQSDHFIGSTDFTKKLETHKAYLDVMDFIKDKYSKKIRKIDFPKIDSHTNSEKTLGSIISGVFTLDPSFFIKGFINNVGELELKPEFKSTQLKETKSLFGIFNFLGSRHAGKMEQIDALSFMDKQVLGYLAYLGISFKQAYMDVIFLILGMGMFWSFGFYMYKKSMAMFEDKDDFNINKTSWLMSAGIAISFFVSPIINDGTIDGNLKKAIYQSNISSGNKNTNWSTPAQQALRYSVQLGNYFGNLTSDYGMHAYLTLVSYKQGMMNSLDDFYLSSTSDLRDVANRKMRLGAEINFYNKVCRDYYNTIKGTMLLSRSTSKDMSLYTDDERHILSGYGVKAKRLDFDACAKMEKEIQNATNNIVAKMDTVRLNIYTTKELFNEDSDARKNFQRYMNTMAFTQNNFGWVDSPIVPISYFFFKNAEYFAYNEKIDNAKKTKVFGDIVENYNDNDEDKGAIQRFSENLGDAATIGTSSMIESSFWFVIPGFDKIFQNTKDTLMSMYVGNVQIYNAIIKAKGTNKSLLTRSIKLVSKMTSKVVAKIPGAGKIISIALDMITPSPKKSALVAMFISILSLFLAIVMIKLVIEAISITIIAVFLAIKITLYMLEILFFYFVSPAIGIFSAIMNNGQSKNFVGIYFQNLAILGITPLLITVTTYLIIVVSEFLRFFFLGLIHMFSSLLNTGAKDLYSSSAVIISNIMKKTMMISMIDGISSIFIYFSVMAVATIMIFNFRDWFTKLIGVDAAVNVMKEGGNEMKQSVTKYVNPVG